MIQKKYKIADRVIEISSIHEDVHSYCEGYESDGEPDFSVVTTQADIDYEKEKTEREYAAEGLGDPNLSQGTYEITAVYRKIAVQMLQYDTFVFHGSCIAVDGQCFLFTANSGTGKSTHTRLWREYLGEKAVMVNDDKPLLRVTNDDVIVYGTPYNGKHRIGCNMSVPLKAICILTRGENNSIKQISKKEAYAMLLQQVYRPHEPVHMMKTMKLLDRMAEKVKIYSLSCNMDITAAEVAYNGMKG